MIAVVCQPLHLTNGMISYSDPTLGLDTVATHICDTGYYLETGQSNQDMQKSILEWTCCELSTYATMLRLFSLPYITHY